MIKLIKILKISIVIVFASSNVLAKTNHFNEGVKFYEKKEFDKAKFKFEQSLVFNPKNEKSYLYLKFTICKTKKKWRNKI